MNVSRETSEMLARYAGLVRQWSPKINLVAASQLDQLEDRHIADCLQLTKLISPGATTITDLGSGGGFPGVILAIDASADHPGRTVTLIESDQRKGVFLRTVIRELNLPAKVISARIDAADVAPADVVTARALAPLPQLLTYSARLLRKDGVAIFPKGETVTTELEDARSQWSFACQEVASETRTNARILVIKDIQRGTAF